MYFANKAKHLSISFFPGKQHRHCLSLLASFLWHQMPFNKLNILEKALVSGDSKGGPGWAMAPP